MTVRLKIAMLGAKGIACSYGGVESHVQSLATRLAAKGHEVTVYSRSHCTPHIVEFKGVRVVRLPCIVSKHCEMPTHVFLSCLATWFKNYDVIHFHSVDPVLFAPAIKPNFRLVCTSQGQCYRRAKWGQLARCASRVAEQFAISRSNEFIVVSKTLKRYYEHRYRREFLYIPNGTEDVHPVDERILLKFGLTPGEYILAVGRLERTKGFDTALEAYRKSSPPEPLVILGASTYTDSYVAELRRSAPPGVKFLGHLTGMDYWAVMQNAKVFVCSSQIEGLSVALLEAMACGRAIVYSDIPENEEAVHGAGLPFRVSDSEELKWRVAALLKDRGLRFHIGSLARARAIDWYSWDAIADQTIAVYERCLDQEPFSQARSRRTVH